ATVLADCAAQRLAVVAHARHARIRAAPTARRHVPERGRARNEYVLRHVDACQTTLNPGFKWERRESIGLTAARRACTPGFHCAPVVVIKGQGVCLGTPSITAEDAREV